ncbi:prepilin-type N-terminal cleavage/methylation domain-containing protein [Microbacterium sp.]|uniref:prepilin-type N-terminal cleavage/methylation domain-containing protein n=1 Tax=Microbacterium sp. TaxID=51671 RepID=UPI003C742444
MSSETRDDDGVGLIEIVVAMLLLAVLALGVLPLIIQATTASVVNRDLVAANNVATAELARIRADFPNDADRANTCDALIARMQELEAEFTAPARTAKFAAKLGDVDCTAGSGTLKTVTVEVFRGKESRALVSAKTMVMVHG